MEDGRQKVGEMGSERSIVSVVRSVIGVTSEMCELGDYS